MDRLHKIGKIIPKSASEVKDSPIGLGFEKLDRNVFDPEPAYDKVAELGVKWIRLLSGWNRTETEKGVYHFEWLDSIVDNLVSRGLRPWICLCYGNALYDERAAVVYGAFGWPPIFNDEQKTAWSNYVKAVVTRYKDRVDHYEVWNEPDGQWCWKHGVSATELGNFTVDTARAVREVMPEAKIIGGSVCLRPIAYLNEAFKTGMGDWIDYISFHEYTHSESDVFERYTTLRALIDVYNPKIGIIQGESGSQSKRGGAGALKTGAWTEERQAKQLTCHTMADLLTGAYFSSYFSCVDMAEAHNGVVGDKSTYKDYGYFGVLRTDFNDDGFASGTYSRKPSFYALQNIASLFAEGAERCELPIVFLPEYSEGTFTDTLSRAQVISGCFRKKNGEAFCYWYPSNIMTTSYEGTVTFEAYSAYDKVSLIDLMDGSIYEIPNSIVSRDEYGVYRFKDLPVKDTPMLLVFGEF